MKRFDLALPWPGVAARLGAFGLPGEESRLTPPMRRVHQSRCARALALELLAEQGVTVDSIPKGPVGEPIWPEGFVGSLAHTEGFAVAVIARTSTCVALGIDVEPALPLPGDAAELVLLDEERSWVASLQDREPGAGRIVFCAKECVHKAIHPLTGTWLDFPEVHIEVDAARERFVPRPLSGSAATAFGGLRAEGLVARMQDQWVVVLALHGTQGGGSSSGGSSA